MSNGIEPELKRIITKILRVITAIIVWSVITIFFGLYLEWALIRGSFNTFNTMFYAWFVISFTALIYYFYRIWSE
ncbi:hypothetical protein [Agriterribacter sp.]|uniref:hypothetical protein n=1 Tax=Agriterribacter sp. TaxID=2821509 RepID=UPI002BA6A352|nr:hypothetical protein [Agriterribacter sp.]HRO44469.1 hypothetical protein [Agriterribacter sp.]HRQ16505.1 hypothetical protein [Agriterribacter sp.]